MLSELSEDPTMSKLAQRIQATQAPVGVNQYIGFLRVTQEGTVELVSPKASLSMLYEVSSWCDACILINNYREDHDHGDLLANTKRQLRLESIRS